MNAESIGKLTELVKVKCKITWSDEMTSGEIEGIVKDAVPSIMHRLGIRDCDEGDILEPGMTRRLFLEYCQYVKHNMAHEFTKNYKEEILMQRHRYEVKYGKEEAKKL